MNERDPSSGVQAAARPRVDAGIVLILLMGLLLALQIAWVLWSGADPVVTRTAAETATVTSAAETSASD